MTAYKPDHRESLVCALCYGKLRKAGIRVEIEGTAPRGKCAECGKTRYLMAAVRPDESRKKWGAVTK